MGLHHKDVLGEILGLLQKKTGWVASGAWKWMAWVSELL